MGVGIYCKSKAIEVHGLENYISTLNDRTDHSSERKERRKKTGLVSCLIISLPIECGPGFSQRKIKLSNLLS